MEKIPYHRPYPLSDIDIEFIQNNIKSILKSGQLKDFRWVPMLERDIKELYDVKYILSTSSCTQGLLICLEYIESIYPIQVSMFNWWSDLYILNILKKKIIWNDIDLQTWLPIERENRYSLYLNTFGNIGRSNSDKVIYDSSHCLGAKIDHIGLAHIFSLAPTKLVTSGEGGIIITNNKSLYDFAKEYRDKCSRMDEIRALIGHVYFSYLEEILKWKKKVYIYYKKYIPGQFQTIPYNSTYNTIGFLNINNLQIPSHIEFRQYYEPIWDSEIKNNTNYIYKKIICLPSFYGVDYKKIVLDILEANNL